MVKTEGQYVKYKDFAILYHNWVHASNLMTTYDGQVFTKAIALQLSFFQDVNSDKYVNW